MDPPCQLSHNKSNQIDIKIMLSSGFVKNKWNGLTILLFNIYLVKYNDGGIRIKPSNA